MTTPVSLYLTPSDSSTSDQSRPGSPSSVQPSSATANSSKSTLDAFTTALCMLNYDIAYLSHTQCLAVAATTHGAEDVWVGVRSVVADDESSDGFAHRVEAQQKEQQLVSNKVKTGLGAGANDE
ncbi:hypothetical protein FRB90_009361 [Tulasnella sp. 427]|nr:hypothetical protein FRB90_009361 [Tulasnella sp. 427]